MRFIARSEELEISRSRTLRSRRAWYAAVAAERSEHDGVLVGDDGEAGIGAREGDRGYAEERVRGVVEERDLEVRIGELGEWGV